MSTADVTVAEDVGSVDVEFTLSALSTADVTVRYRTVEGTALADTADEVRDFAPVAGGMVVIAAGDLSASVPFVINDDALDEVPTETFKVIITGVVNAALDADDVAGHSALVTIADNDDEPSLSVADVTVSEGDGVARVVFTLDAVSGRDVVTGFETLDWEAVEGSDFAVASSSLTIPAGQLSSTLDVTILEDVFYESDETFGVGIRDVHAALLGPSAVATVTVEDDDEAPVLRAADVTVGEDAKVAAVVFTLNERTGHDVRVRYRTVEGSALENTADEVRDFAPVALGEAIVGAGDLLVSVPFLINDDALDEDDETFAVEITGVTNAVLDVDNPASDRVTVTIGDNDDLPVVSAADVTVDEDAGSAEVVFTLSAPSGRAVTVNYRTAEGSAQADTASETWDFTPVTAGRAVIAAGEVSASVQVTVHGDGAHEAHETFTVDITGATNATVDADRGSATVTITDDDAISASFASTVLEVREGDTTVHITVNLSPVPQRPIELVYTTDAAPLRPRSGAAPEGGAVRRSTAEHGQDFVRVPSEAVEVRAGQVSVDLPVSILEDAIDEAYIEWFSVWLSADSVDAVVPSAPAIVRILDDDDPPVVSAADVTVDEDAGSAEVVFTLSAPSGLDVEVRYSTAEGSALADTAPATMDFTPVTAGQAVIVAGEVSASVRITINDDLLSEADETFTVDVTGATNATVDADRGSATVTIIDDDYVVAAFTNPVLRVSEGSIEAVLQVSFSPAPTADIQLVYSTGVGAPDAAAVVGSEQAVAGVDYITVVGGTVDVSAGQATAQVRVRLREDLLDESDTEWFVVSVSPVHVGAASVATVLIVDNDNTPFVGTADVAFAEAADRAEVEFRLSAPSGLDVEVRYSTAEGSARADTADELRDFAPVTAGQAVIAAGEMSVRVPVTINDDVVHEAHETFTVDITGATNATVDADRGSATVTITDDDGVAASWAPRWLLRGEGAGRVTLSVSLSPAPERDIQLVYTTDSSAQQRSRWALRNQSVTSSSATPGHDFVRVAPTTVTVAAGADSVELPVTIIDDALDEADTEWFLVSLSADLADATTPPQSAAVHIADNDDPPTVSVAGATVGEADGRVEVLFTLDRPSGRDITVRYTTAAGTAQPSIGGVPLDYTPATGSVTLVAGSTIEAVAVAINDDSVHEADETFTVDIAGAAFASVAPDGASATITIIDDDDVSLSVTDIEVTEFTTGEAESTIGQAESAAFVVTLSAASTKTVTVQYATADGSAASGRDYTAAEGILTFAPGVITVHIDVPILDDDLDEHDETFTVSLSSPTNAVLDDDAATATATILDNDDMPTVSISADTASVTEGTDTGFTVSLDAPSGRAVTVTVTASGSGTHPAGSDDYRLHSQTVTLEPGNTSAIVAVTATQDTLDEHDETFSASVAADYATPHASNSTATITIADDDAAPILIADAEPATEGSTATVTLTLSAASGRTVTVRYSIVDVSTTSDDYTHTPSDITFAPGTTSATISIDIDDDDDEEADEEFVLEITEATNLTAAIGISVTILANDAASA